MKFSLKNKVLVFCFIISSIIVYKFALGKTIETNRLVLKLEKEKLTLDNISSVLTNLQAEEHALDSILKSYNLSINNSFQQSLLKNLTTTANKNKLQIISFNKPHEYRSDITKLKTYSFEIKGDFISILKMINELEQLQLGEFISIDFQKKSNYKTGRKFLTCKILLQKMGE